MNYYEILGVTPNASDQDIKRSFRRKAKEAHPDISVLGGGDSETRIRHLITAYEILSDPGRRAEYDRAHKHSFRTIGFDYREYLRTRTDDLRSQAKLVFYDLLNSQDTDAIDLYERLTSNGAELILQENLSRGDFMDCAFLLAEAYDRRGDFVKACEIYKKLYECEIERPYFRHFVVEVVERLRIITCVKMVPVLPVPATIQYIKDMIDLDFSRKDSAFFCKRIAEIYAESGDTGAAIQYLQKGLELDGRLAGVKKLKEKLGIEEYSVR